MKIPESLKILFPNLNKDAEMVGVPSEKYNCIMYALGANAWNIWPFEGPGSFTANIHGNKMFWPEDLPKDKTLNNFLNLFKKFKYELCDNDKFESGFKKIAIFCKKNSDIVTHAALIGKDFALSKLGEGPIIRHSLYSIEGEIYGEVRCFIKRPGNITKDFDISVITKYIK